MLRAASAVAAMRCCSPLTCWSDDLHDLPLIERNWRLIGKAQSRAIRFNEHLTGGGPDDLQARLPDGAGRDRVEADGGLSKTWLKSKELGERGGAPGARGGWR